MATSPVLYQDLVILFCGLTREPRLLALKKQTGEVVYDYRLKDTGYCHSTPLLARLNGKPQLLVAASSKEAADNAVQVFDPASGKRLWWAAGVAASASPLVAQGCVYFDSGRGGQASLVEVNGTGDVTATHRRWTTNVAESLGSPVIVDQHIYRLHNNGLFVCRSFKTGEVVYQQRVRRFRLGEPDRRSPGTHLPGDGGPQRRGPGGREVPVAGHQ
jgi:hypothetical protein